MKHVTHVRTDWRRRHEGSRQKGERANVIPRDSKDGAKDEESANDERASVAMALRSSVSGGDSRVSRVVAMVMAPAAPISLGKASGSSTREEDVVTAVDGALEALSEEQHAALARRIRLAMEHPGMDQTLRLGTPVPRTPSPAPVQPSSFIAPPPNPSSVPPASVERVASSFKKTMLLGLPRLSTDAAPVPPSSPSSSVPSVRASVVREVGPPTTPPPRRSRRAGAFPLPADVSADELDASDWTDAADAEREPPDHDAFQLDHRIVSPEVISREASSRERAPGSVNSQTWLDAARSPLAPRAGLILPPPPGPRDLEPSSPTGFSRPARVTPARATPPLADLPSTDPFAGFIAPPPSFARRWATVLVIALAVVGVVALAALALRWLTNASW